MNHYSKKSWAGPMITRVVLMSDAQVKEFVGTENFDATFQISTGPIS